MISELSTYRITDFLMFSKEALFGVYESYNQALWPVQIPCFLVSLILLSYFAQGLLLRSKREYLLITATFSLAWFSQGLVFHYVYLSQIIWAAHYFILLSLLEGVLLFMFALSNTTPPRIKKSKISIALFLIAAVLPLEMLWGGGWHTATLFPWGMNSLALGTLALLINQPARLLTVLLALLPLLFLVANFIIALEI